MGSGGTRVNAGRKQLTEDEIHLRIDRNRSDIDKILGSNVDPYNMRRLIHKLITENDQLKIKLKTKELWKHQD